MRTVLICQEDAPLARVGMARWLHSCSDLAGLIVLRETGGRRWKRIQKEASRIGWLRMLDVFAFRVHQWLFLAKADADFCKAKLEELCAKYPPLPEGCPSCQHPAPTPPSASSS